MMRYASLDSICHYASYYATADIKDDYALPLYAADACSSVYAAGLRYVSRLMPAPTPLRHGFFTPRQMLLAGTLPPFAAALHELSYEWHVAPRALPFTMLSAY